jgi:PAS domain S-box-containing protein
MLRSPSRADSRPLFLCYGVAIATAALALLLALLLQSALAESVFPLFLAAVMFSAWYGGLGPGLVTTLLTTLASAYYFLANRTLFAIDVQDTLVRLVVFAVAALLISSLNEARRRAEATLQEQRERFAVTLASIGDAVIATDMRGRVTFMNPVAEALTGWTLAEAQGQDLARVFRIVNEDTRQPVENPTIQVLREGMSVSLAHHTALLAKDGTLHPIDDSGAPIRNEQGQISGVVLVFRDISAHKQAEELLARYQLLSEQARDIILFIRLDGQIVEANAAACDTYGYSRDELLALHITDLRDSATQSAIPMQMQQANDAGILFETTHRRKDGSHLPVEVSARGAKIGRERLLLSIVRDISERKRTAVERQQLAEIVKSSNDAIIGKGLDGIIHSWNAGAERIYGYSAEEAIGRSIELLVPRDRPSELADILARLARGESINNYETVRVRKDGVHVPVSISISPIKGVDGSISGASTIARDISDRKQAEQERAQLLARERTARAAAEASASRLAFLAEASRVLASSLDYPTRLASIARQAVPRLADWCAVRLLNENGTLQQVALTHIDPAKIALAQELDRRYPTDPNAASGVYKVARTGTKEFYPEITDAMLVAAAQDADHLAVMRKLAFTSAINVPLLTNGRTLGVLTLVSAESGYHYTEDDLAMAEDLANRAASAIDNARLYYDVQEQRERFAVTLASIGDAVIATDTHGRVTFMNAVAEALTGWTLADAQGQALADVFRIVNEYTGQVVESPAARALREGVIIGLANHTILIAKDGTVHPIDDSGAPIRSATGELIGTVMVFRDVAERRRAEIELQETNQMLRTLVDASPLAISVLDSAGKVELWNPAAERIFGWHADEVLGRRLPAGSADTQAARQPNPGNPSQNNAISGQETRRQRKDGALIDIDLWTAPLRDQTGEINRVVNVVANITQRKRAEEALRFLSEASTTLVSSLDYETTLANIVGLAVPALADYCTIHLIEPDEQLHPVASAHSDPVKHELLRAVLAHARSNTDTPKHALQVLQTGHSQLGTALDDDSPQTLAQSAEQRWLSKALGAQSYIAVPLGARGRVFGVITLFTAESGRHYAPDDLALVEELAQRAALAVDNAQLYLEAQRAIHVRDQFLSIAAHELKTPLTSLLGQAQLLQRRASKENSLQERDQRTVRVIGDQAMRLNRMISALLDISRIQTGQLSIERAPIDICALTRRVVDEVQPILQQHTVICADSESLMIEGDEVRLEQVLQNLIQNAIKYSPAGGPITVRAEQRGSMACVQVTDQGIGIPQEALPQLFQRFYRAPNADAQHISGMGVGLHVVNEIVALHGGVIEVTSAEEQGSTFTVCFPLAHDLAAAQHTLAPENISTT